MNKQFVWALVATLGLAGCGGGGGGGGSDDVPSASTGDVSTEELQGTWMLTTETTENGEWLNTRRQTITLTRTSNSAVNFKDCFEASGSSWTLDGDALSRSGQPTFTVVDEDTLTATSNGGATQIRMTKLNGNTSPVVADVNIDSILGRDVSAFTWNPVCLETYTTDAAGLNKSLNLKIDGQNGALTGSVTLNFVSTQTYPGRYISYTAGNRNDENISGLFSATFGLTISGMLSNPSGTLTVVPGEEIVMYFDLVMDSTAPGYDEVDVAGSMAFNSEWLAEPSSP